MKEIKRRLESFAPYDCTGIAEHLEQMAQEGWMLDMIGVYLWKYRRIEPRKLHFTVTYLPNISEFDPENTESLLEMEEYCTKDGWKLAARNAKMQVFYHEGEAPRPIETDAMIELQTIHHAMCKQWLLGQGFNVLLSVTQLALAYMRFADSPISFFSNPIQLYMPLLWLVLLVISLGAIGKYLLWYRRAKRQVEYGVLPPAKRTIKINFTLLGLELVILVLLLASPKIALLSLTGVFGVVAISNAGMAEMKRQGVSRGINQAVSIGLCVCLTFAMLFGVGWFVFQDRHKPVGYYDLKGWKMEVFADPLPLYVQDLLQTEQKDWSTETRKNETFALANTEYIQRPLTQSAEVPELSYTITEVRLPALYDLCKAEKLGQHQEKWDTRRYQAVDAAPWSAQAVYQEYEEDLGAAPVYLLFYETHIVEIAFNWEPTAEQMQIVAQKLGDLNTKRASTG